VSRIAASDPIRGEQILYPTELVGRNEYETEEYKPVDIPLSDLLIGTRLDLYEQVTAKGYFSLGLRRDQLVFRASGFVGLIPINDRVAIQVRPRVPVANLVHLLLVAEMGATSIEGFERGYGIGAEQVPFMLDHLTLALLKEIDVIAANGLHREYMRVPSASRAPAGRVLFSGALMKRKAQGDPFSVPIVRHKQTADTTPNRCLKYAIWYVAQRYRQFHLRAGVRRLLDDLNGAYLLFGTVSLDHSQSFFNDARVQLPERMPAVRAYYVNALRLAAILIRDRGVTLEMGAEQLAMDSWVVNMADVFEAYARRILARELALSQSELLVLDGNLSGPGGGRKLLFDSRPSEEATPDIVIERQKPGRSPAVPVVLDAKYKERAVPDRDDINQIVTYALSYRSVEAVLVFPREHDGPQGLRFLGTINEVRLSAYSIDLGAVDLHAEETAFATAVRELVEGSLSKEVVLPD
jgi:5-methylcytosine-specific restriction enzyme subunit McrC